MAELTVERRAVKDSMISLLLNLNFADMKEAAELDRVDFDTLMEEIRTN